MRKKVEYKKRSKKHAYEEGFYEGRTCEDYRTLDGTLRANIVQMDCVEGVEEDVQALLTLHFVNLRFQACIFLSRKDLTRKAGASDYVL